ncbi:unnamed protein product [Penicillium salamii]|uniref:Uncharacterized protein n=1 Tax=Penicillium salamii TaxID=1612424 RepID=A0A9W4IE68_9EURO|nr:unnamed protein product [Penicillium salamii]
MPIGLICSSKLYNMSIARLPYRRILPLPSTQPVLRATSVRHYAIFKDWKGNEEHTTERSKKGDTTDVHAEASASGMKERETNEGVADGTKSQGTTERGGTKYSSKAKKENPKAPEPIIGMNDERGKASEHNSVRGYMPSQFANCALALQKGD